MKTLCPILAVLISSLAGLAAAQSSTVATGAGQNPVPAPTAAAITAQDASSRVWAWQTYEQAPNGQIVPHQHSYTELATGLNHVVNGQWAASSEHINILPNGTAAAGNGQHQAYFPGDIYSGQIKLVTSDGLQLYSRPLGLCYFDGTNTVLIAVLTNSIGQVAGDNQVIYTNAFMGFRVDLQYTYTLAGFEQDIILRQQPPTPESLGLNPDTTRLEVLTEFFNPPQPSISSRKLAPQAGLTLTDQTIGFGTMRMVPGRAFLLGNQAVAARAHVNKQWVLLNGRQFLVEEVPVDAIVNQLAALPLTAMNSGSGNASHLASTRLTLPKQRLARNDPFKTLMLAKVKSTEPGYVLDYQTVNSSLTNFTFQGDTTYWVSDTVYLGGNTTFEGGTVIKYGVYGVIQVDGSYLCQTGPYRPAVFTSMNDNTVGEGISGSSGTPGSSDSTWDLYITSTGGILKNVRFSYTMRGVAQSGLQIWDSQFSHCNGFGADEMGSRAVLNNVLFDHCDFFAVIQDSYAAMTLVGDHVTADQCGALIPSASSAILTNCILTAVTNLVNATLQNCFTNATGAGIFQTVGAGSYYLATNSIYRNAGTTNIDPALLADLATKTTYPPIVYSNTVISVNTTFPAQAQRDTDTPDLGYHYDPLDYVFGGCTASASLRVCLKNKILWFGKTACENKCINRLI